jgi:hypothetical protein
MEKIINKLINESTKGVDIYNHNGSTWLIFTESKQWVIELTEGKTLWYNFNFFKNLFAYASLEVVQNQHLITKWVEDNLMNAVKETSHNATMFQSMKVEDTIENGVKETELHKGIRPSAVEDTIENGVKETKTPGNGDLFSTIQRNWADPNQINEVIKEGVKKIKPREDAVLKSEKRYINEIIQSGVKSSNPRQYVGEDIIDKVIDKGVNETYYDVYQHKGRIDGVIKNGVKETKNAKGNYMDEVDIVIKNGIKETHPMENSVNSEQWFISEQIVNNHIQTGIKEIKPLPSQTGNKDWSEYSHGREDRTKPFNDYLNDTLEMGVKIKKGVYEYLFR